ncbi:MAG: hypothetical protein JJV98_14730 [Desulfosarcina sp.]|nr:hypothetical protein [Desulfobacterales bacterium]
MVKGPVKKFDDGSVGLEFVAEGYKYRDRYYGFNPFSGSEHVYDDQGALIWVMNYYGEVLPTHSDPQKIYLFLRESMSSITPAYPFRGPAKLERGNLRYQNDQNGTLDRFDGVESIYAGDESVYFLRYHGGNMTKNT